MSAETPVPEQRIDLASIRRRLADSTGRRFFKSLEELSESPGFLEFLHREFPHAASEWSDPGGRRDFLRVMSASLALAGLTACTRQPDEKIVPYVKAPEDVIPGRPLFFATAVLRGGYANGVLVESHMGRPTKIEGNPDHPASLGATDLFGQADILGLYDPDRSQTLTQMTEIRPWGAFLAAVKTALEAQRPLKGAGLRLLTGTVTSPTLAGQIDALLADFPSARWHQWEPLGRDNVLSGARMAFGEAVETRYHLDKADRILCLDADFVSGGPGNLAQIREFTSRRKITGSHPEMSRIYVAETTVSLTGSLADHRLPLRPSELEGFARAVAAGLGLGVQGASADNAAWVAALVKDLQSHRGAAVVMAGESQPAAVHALAHAMNDALGATGRTVTYMAPVEPHPAEQLASLSELVADMRGGKVDLLVMLGVNPVYDAPADLEFTSALEKVPIRIHHGLYDDETAEHCHWHVPACHSLEAWSDARAFDGTATILQPLIAPLYTGTKSAHEMLAALTDRPERTGHDIVKDYWRSRLPGADPERAWRKALHDGSVADSALPAKPVTLKLGEWARGGVPSASKGYEIVFRPDPSIGDGRYANNGWLQELPKHLTKLTWENVALVSLKTAQALGIAPARSYAGNPESAGKQTDVGTITDVVELTVAGRPGVKVKAPAWIVPGHPDGVVTVHLGYGRTRAGRVGTGIGFSAYALRTSAGLWSTSGLDVRKTGETVYLACTQDHWTMEGRNPVRAATLEEFTAKHDVFEEMGEEPPHDLTLYKNDEFPETGHKWGMAIDLNSCVGCNACMVACQSENNVPVVGKDQVTRGREMHWLRIDRYYAGEGEAALSNPETYHQPIPCMQCENAPCEVVCPVAATTHSDEGLNDMVYNRCVGTRYCSNNCPYKVRRFNFYLYQDWYTQSLKLQRNPDVSVRSRGVMEKCTYCVQRINQTRITAKNEGRPIKDGEIQTACQQACPAEAIAFGDLADKASRVSKLKQQPRNYGLLAELNTRPRTTYLAAVKNPNPEMPKHG